jgi:hypothetical protein
VGGAAAKNGKAGTRRGGLRKTQRAARIAEPRLVEAEPLYRAKTKRLEGMRWGELLE